MNQVDLAYYAGFFDGEGNVIAFREKDRRFFDGFRYRVRTQVSNNNPAPLKEIQACYGGRLFVRVNNGNRKPSWYLTFGHPTSQKFLSEILPYLRIKRKQAELALEFIKSVHRRGGNEWIPRLTRDEQTRREKLRNQIRALNAEYHG